MTAPSLSCRVDLRLAHTSNTEKFYRVEKMKFGGKRRNADKTTTIFNGNITINCAPLEAYDCVVNGKPARSLPKWDI
ncbi:type ISP restriction/modification enzyme [Novosphingobium sp.]|uniref:type ISP restriction/modification enzyme n=1 Tax=Novosphingobium sp. TaxID=1874826 RepID=UPI00260EDA00|nr:type ISP restriction/modification enzyme [Novosphingobium sp.]